MRALSGLTPALSRRLQRQLLAHLPPAAARSLRRTLSLHAAPTPAPRAARSLSADHQPTDQSDPKPSTERTPTSPESTSEKSQESVHEKSPEVQDIATPLYSTLPRLRRRSETREGTHSLDAESVSASSQESSRTGARAADRSLLSKYLTPERTLSLDESCGSDAASATSEPGCTSPQRRPSSRAPSADPPRRRVSRFLRSDFFDSPPDENLYERHRKEREMETQKILREIREKKNKSQEASARTYSDIVEAPLAYRDDVAHKKSLSPMTLLAAKERSRSNTPFFPILDNIKETAVDMTLSTLVPKRYTDVENSRQKSSNEDTPTPKESRLIRPRSYPVKTLDSIDEPSESVLSETSLGVDFESKEKLLPRESKLLRPKSYPASSPSPEKVYITRSLKKEDSKTMSPKEEVKNAETNNDVEVSFSITLPKKSKPDISTSSESHNNSTVLEQNNDLKSEADRKLSESSLLLKKYQVLRNKESDKPESTEIKTENGTAIVNNASHDDEAKVISNGNAKNKTAKQSTKKDEEKVNDIDQSEKKGTVKKKIIRKVSSKSKTDLGINPDTGDIKPTVDKKKVTKKVKEKVIDEDGVKPTVVIKKKSMLQSIGQKLEKFTSAKSSSPEKSTENGTQSCTKKNNSKLSRMQREQSVPVNIEPTTESNLIKRAVTLTDVAGLENQSSQQSKTTVSKVLGLFKKFEPKERTKSIIEKSVSENIEKDVEKSNKVEAISEDNQEKDKPRRPTSLLLNGIGRKNKYGRTSSDSVSTLAGDSDDHLVLKKENDSKNIRNSLKLDFSRLPRVKKIVPTNPVIEPQIINISSIESETEKINIPANTLLLDSNNIDNCDPQSRSRSRSRSTISNSELKSDLSADTKFEDKNPLSLTETTTPLRTHDPTTPEKEDIVDRIRRKSFYSRFNEKKQRRKSNLVGPGAAEYDPVARIHSQSTESKYDVSPTSPVTYDLSPLSPGLSASSDLSPSTERYRSLLADLPVTTRSNLRFENYGLNDKIDTYRSLDRNDFRKYPGSRTYLEYEQPTYGTSRYARTKSLLENSEASEENNSLGNFRDPHKYNRTLSMYSPGSYATYRPKRTTRNSAIILKESEKEPSPENILDKIKQRKISISVTRKPDPEKEPLSRSNISSKGEGNGAECSEKVD